MLRAGFGEGVGDMDEFHHTPIQEGGSVEKLPLLTLVHCWWEGKNSAAAMESWMTTPPKIKKNYYMIQQLHF